jgi:hypothetical protein
MMINRTALALLALGALLFSAIFYLATTQNVLGWTQDGGDGTGLLTPPMLIALYTIAFGLPYALYELTRRTNWLAILYVLIVIPAVHYGAMYAFLWYTGQGENVGTVENAALYGGFLAGFAGALLSFLLLFLFGLRSATAGVAVFFAGLLLLTAWGGLAFKLLPDAPETKDIVLKLYLPWQIIFAFFLSALLRASPRRGV